jgi:hypothetical protein
MSPRATAGLRNPSHSSWFETTQERVQSRHQDIFACPKFETNWQAPPKLHGAWRDEPLLCLRILLQKVLSGRAYLPLLRSFRCSGNDDIIMLEIGNPLVLYFARVRIRISAKPRQATVLEGQGT